MKLTLNVQTHPDPIAQARKVLEQTIYTYAQKKTPILLLLSGGSNLKLVSQDNLSLLNQCTIMPLDERYSAKPALNNSLQLIQQGLTLSPFTPYPKESVKDMGVRFHKKLHDWYTSHPNGITIATLGMGPDGHIAGISPMPDDAAHFRRTFLRDTQLAVGYTGNLEPPQRITTTPLLIQTKVDHCVGTITGSSKQDALRQLLSSSENPEVIPARLLYKAKGEINLFTDQDIT